MSLRSSSLSLAVLSALALPSVAAEPTPPPTHVYIARAYAIPGRTADGSRVRRGIVAADPHILPMGTRILLSGAGKYSGEYVVRDTGPHVRGHRLDVYVPTVLEARKFGRRPVTVQVLAKKTP